MEHAIMTTITTSRRAVLAGAAALPALAAPAALAAVSTADPVLAAIERYRKTYARLNECLTIAEDMREVLKEQAGAAAEVRTKDCMQRRADFERSNPDYRFSECQEQVSRRMYCAEVEKLKSAAEWQQADEIEDKAHKENTEAARALARTVPKTPAQALAMIAFIRECEDAGDDITMTYNEDDAPAFMDILVSLETFFRTQLS